MSADTPLTPEDLYRLRVVNDVCLSPDAKHAAVTVSFADEAKDEYRSLVSLISTENGTARALTAADKRSWAPQFSPDGTRLAFLSNRSGADQIWMLSLQGGEPTQLTFFKKGASAPRWSPDGKRIAFLSAGGEREEPAPGSETKSERKKDDKPAVRVVTSVRHKEDGRGYFQDRINHIFVVASDGGEPTQVTDGADEDKSPAWSPDGTQLAFASNRTGDQSSDVLDIWTVPSDASSPPRCLTKSNGSYDVPQWSPDGKRIALLGVPHLRQPGRATRVGLLSPEGGDPVWLTDPDRLNFASVLVAVGHASWLPPPCWTVKGIVALGNERGRQNLYLVAEGHPPQPLTEGDRCIMAFDAATDGSLAVFSAGHVDDPSNVYLARGGEVRSLTDLNPWLRERARTEVEAFSYRSSDGTEVDAWITNPAAVKREEPRPLVLLIHGGPHCSYGYAWNRSALLYAAAGYRVLVTNPRGSAGYGEAFARAIHPQQGDIDQADLLAGVAAAIGRGGVVADRIAVTGGSYGGFMTNMLVGRSDRFRTGVTIACISNWTSYYGTADYGWMMAWEFEDEVWRSEKRYISQSPLTYAATMNTPLLILHGEDDLRCPIEQAEQLFIVLQRRGVKCEMRRYPGEPHGIGSRRPSFAVDAAASTLEWFRATL